MERWLEIAHPYGKSGMKYLQIRPPPGNPASANLRSRPSEGATVIPYAEAGPYKPLIWMKRFSIEDQRVFFSNSFTGESVWAGTPEAKALLNRMDYILQPPREEREAFEAWKAARDAPPLTEEEVTAREAERENALTRAERDQQRREAEAQAAERQRQLDAAAATSRPANIPRIAPENLAAEGARLLAMDYNGLQQFFGFPRGRLPEAETKQLEKIAKRFLSLMYHPDVSLEILGEALSRDLFQKLNNKFGRDIGSPPRPNLIGSSKKHMKICQRCGNYKI